MTLYMMSGDYGGSPEEVKAPNRSKWTEMELACGPGCIRRSTSVYRTHGDHGASLARTSNKGIVATYVEQVQCLRCRFLSRLELVADGAGAAPKNGRC